MRKIKLLIVDDSALIRNILSSKLSKYEDIEIVGKAYNPYEARDMIVKYKPDVITLDIEMPRMDGLEFIGVLMKYSPLPIVVVSSLTTGNCEISLKALELGAVDIFPKPTHDISNKLPMYMKALYEKIKTASTAKLRLKKIIGSGNLDLADIDATEKIIAIGSSTGGTKALARVIEKLPGNLPPVIITQHMPSGFTKAFADRLNTTYKNLEIKEAEDNQLLYPGLVLIAPGDFHLLIKRYGAKYKTILKKGPKVHHQRPAVDVMFSSVAKIAGKNAYGIILTGMGADGAEGLLEIRKNGGHTIAQNEESCVVFGMPKEAIAINGAEFIEHLDLIPEKLIRLIKGK